MMKLNCRKCRQFLLDSKDLVDSHGKQINECAANMDVSCVEDYKEPIWYINYDTAPDWMKGNFNQGNWLKGKIFCPKCDGRLGSYNFVQPRKCACLEGLSQPVWMLKSRVDVGIKPVIRQPTTIVIDNTWTVINKPLEDTNSSNDFLEYSLNNSLDSDISEHTDTTRRAKALTLEVDQVMDSKHSSCIAGAE